MPYIDDKNGNRFLLGLHRARVVDRNDTSEISDTPHRGRIKVQIPYLLDDREEPFHFWCDYCGPSHQFFSIPDVGTMVYVMFNAGNPEQPVWIGAVNTTNATKDPPNRFRRDEPDVSGYESLQGHFLEFNDISGERRIRIEDINANYFEWDTEQNDLNVYFAHNEDREIGNDRFTDIGHDDQLDIGNDNRITIGNDQTRDIGNDQTLTVANDQTETIDNSRTTTIENDDSLTVTTGSKTIDVNTGSWQNTIEQEYTLTGQSFYKADFQDKIENVTQDKFIIDAQSDIDFTSAEKWVADITDEVDWTFDDDWTAAVTGAVEFTADDDITLDTQTIAKLKNILFEFELGLATATWKIGATSIIMTAASITITVGGTTQTWTAGGSTFSGSTYILSGVDHIPHVHPVFAVGVPTGPPQ